MFVCQWRNTGEERGRTLSRCALPLLSPPLFTSPPPCSLSPLLSSTSTTLSSSSPPPHSEPIAALTPPSDSGPSRIFPLSVRSNPFFSFCSHNSYVDFVERQQATSPLQPALSVVEDTGAPGPPLPADGGSGQAVGGAYQSLPAAAAVRAGRVGHFFLVDLWRN